MVRLPVEGCWYREGRHLNIHCLELNGGNSKVAAKADRPSLGSELQWGPKARQGLEVWVPGEWIRAWSYHDNNPIANG